MANEQKPLFREKSMQQISSPEQLNTYIKVSNAGVFMILIAMIIFLAGALVWGVFGRIEIYQNAVARVESGTVEIYIPYASFENRHVPETLRYEINNEAFPSILERTCRSLTN